VTLYDGGRIEIVREDITSLDVEVIVNAANAALVRANDGGTWLQRQGAVQLAGEWYLQRCRVSRATSFPGSA
jgi:O-acetyl-ADP-ribose deacetylase (regulator of RNase III)